jgi:hypothetical protein
MAVRTSEPASAAGPGDDAQKSRLNACSVGTAGVVALSP